LLQVLVPEGLLGSIPELKVLLNELDAIAVALNRGEVDLVLADVLPALTPWASSLLQSLPEFAQSQVHDFFIDWFDSN
jgi:hypothetical protein